MLAHPKNDPDDPLFLLYYHSLPITNFNAGIFKKVGDMTFIMPTDTFSDEFEEGKRKKRNAVLDTQYLWPGGIVPYEISSYFNGESLSYC